MSYSLGGRGEASWCMHRRHDLRKVCGLHRQETRANEHLSSLQGMVLKMAEMCAGWKKTDWVSFLPTCTHLGHQQRMTVTRAVLKQTAGQRRQPTRNTGKWTFEFSSRNGSQDGHTLSVNSQRMLSDTTVGKITLLQSNYTDHVIAFFWTKDVKYNCLPYCPKLCLEVQKAST